MLEWKTLKLELSCFGHVIRGEDLEKLVKSLAWEIAVETEVGRDEDGSMK